MLKSILHEIIGTRATEAGPARWLRQFGGEKRVLIVFADTEDDRAIRQDEMLRKAQLRLIEEDIEVFVIAGGGVFPLFEGAYELDADEVRDSLQGPNPGEFGLMLIGRDGTVRLRSAEPRSAEEIFRAFAMVPRQKTA